MATRLVIEWTRASVRLALAEGRGPKWRLRALHSQPIGAGIEHLEALRTFLRDQKVTADEVIAVISREQVITRVVKFQTTEHEELSQMA